MFLVIMPHTISRLENWDEASLSIHGHYPYLNLFESNYAEYANVDFVWGENGPYNTFFRNYIYHKGFFFGFVHNQVIRVENGNSFNNIVANISELSAGGSNNYIKDNYKLSRLDERGIHKDISYYYDEPAFISWGRIFLAMFRITLGREFG